MFNNLPDWLHFIFGFLGMLTFCFTAAGLLAWITETIRKSMDRASYIHKQKHRFDKPPIAKCYCRDCSEWQPDKNTCWHSGIHMAAYEFCSSAFPMNEERDICKKCNKSQ